jgi:hypothetical protein
MVGGSGRACPSLFQGTAGSAGGSTPRRTWPGRPKEAQSRSLMPSARKRGGQRGVRPSVRAQKKLASLGRQCQPRDSQTARCCAFHSPQGLEALREPVLRLVAGPGCRAAPRRACPAATTAPAVEALQQAGMAHARARWRRRRGCPSGPWPCWASTAARRGRAARHRARPAFEAQRLVGHVEHADAARRFAASCARSACGWPSGLDGSQHQRNAAAACAAARAAPAGPRPAPRARSRRSCAPAARPCGRPACITAALMRWMNSLALAAMTMRAAATPWKAASRPRSAV